MAFREFSSQQSVQLLQRSLERGRLAHAYLFNGHNLDTLEDIAASVGKTLNCERPVRRNGAVIDCCEECASCVKIRHGNHPDVHWVRPESKSRIITVDQVRELMREIQLKPKESRHKVAVIVAADRLRVEGGNAFLKTLEEPPPDSVIILLTLDPQLVLETLLSRCLRLSFGQAMAFELDPAQRELVGAFSESAASEQKSLMSRYRLLDVLLQRLGSVRAKIEETLAARSPLEQNPDAERNLVERWEDELKAAVEAEYRRQRTDLISALHWWLRDVWVQTICADPGQSSLPSLLRLPEFGNTRQLARRLEPKQAMANLQILEQLQRWLGSNVQEALALEVSLLKLHL